MELQMSEEDLPLSDKLLLSMHNLCIVRPEIAKTGEEIASSLKLAVENALSILADHEARGYVRSLIDSMGARRFYLTSMGMIKVCSSFT